VPGMEGLCTDDGMVDVSHRLPNLYMLDWAAFHPLLFPVIFTFSANSG
jgi:hypothetical protein